MEITLVILSIALIIFSVFAILVHILGLYLLRQPNPLEVNQKLYLTHMSILEISIVLCQNISISFSIFKRNSAFDEYAHLILYSVGFSWSNVLIMLTFDRFLQVYLNIKYGVYVKVSRTKIIIFFCYLVGICFCLLLIAVNIVFHISLRIVRSYFYPAYGVLVVLTFVATYLYIYKKIRIARTTERVQSTNHRIKRQRCTFVPFWIIFTYIILVLIPCTIFVLTPHNHQSEKYMPHVWRLFWIVSFITDALIYTLFNEPIKKVFVRFINKNQVFVQTERSVFVVDCSERSTDTT